MGEEGSDQEGRKGVGAREWEEEERVGGRKGEGGGIKRRVGASGRIKS